MVARVTGGKALPAEVVDADRGQDRRRAAVRRGADQDGAGIGPAAGRGRPLRAGRAAAAARDPGDAARLADGPPRPPRAGQGGRADRRRASAASSRYELLAAVAGRCPRPSCSAALDQLVAAELVFRRGTPPDATYSFKHALVQDAAYDSLLSGKRQQLHAADREGAGGAVPGDGGDPAGAAGAALLRGRPRRAVHRVPLAGRAARRRALRQPGGGRPPHEGAGGAGYPARSPAARRARADVAGRARHAADRDQGLRGPGDRRRLCARARAVRADGARHRLPPIVYGRWAYHLVGGEHETGRRLAEEFLALAESRADTALELVGRRILPGSLLHLGELQAGQARIEQALGLYDPRRHRSLAFRFGQDQQASGLAFLGLALWLAGFPDQASRTIDRALGVLEGLTTPTAGGTSWCGAPPRWRSYAAMAWLSGSTSMRRCPSRRSTGWACGWPTCRCLQSSAAVLAIERLFCSH